MYNQTGLLGTKYSRLGLLTLGVGPGSAGTPREDVLTVTETIAFRVFGQHPISMIDAITVSSVPTVAVTTSTEGRVTQAVVEVIYNGIITARITQAVVEVVYKKANSQAVVDSITLAESRSSASPSKHQTVTHAITLSDTNFGRNTIVRQIVLTTISVAVPEAERDTRVRLSKIDTATVSETIGAFSGYFTLHDNVSVATSISLRNTVVRKSLTDSISVSEPSPPPSSNVIRLTVVDAITLPQYLLAQWPATSRVIPIRLHVTQPLVLAENVAGGGPIQHKAVTDTIALSEQFQQHFFVLSVTDLVAVTSIIAGGPSIRRVTVSDSVTATSIVLSRTNPVHQSVSDIIRVQAVHDSRGPRVPITVTDVVAVFPSNAPRILYYSLVVTDALILKEVSRPHGSVRVSPLDAIALLDNNRAVGPRHESITDNLTIASRPKLLSQRVKDAVTLVEARHRVFPHTVFDTLTVNSLVAKHSDLRRVVRDPITVLDTTQQQNIFVLDVQDHMPIPEDYYLLPVSFSGELIHLPTARGILVSTYLTLTSAKGAIVLPAALLGNARGNVESVIVQRSMNAKTVTIIKSSDREKLKLSFRLSLRKSFELRQFIINNISEIITLTTWDADVWVGYIMNNPFETTHAGRSGPVENEFANVELDFEGVKS